MGWNILPTYFYEDGRERKLCRKKSRSWKSWFEGKTDKNIEQSHALLPLVNNEQKGHLEQRRQRRKSEFLLKAFY